MTATIFMICDLPATGYGLSDRSLAKLESQSLQIFAISVIKNNGIITKENIQTINITYSNILEEEKSVKSWIPVQFIIKQLNNTLEKLEKLNIVKFARTNNEATQMANGLSSSISIANRNLKDNIKKKKVRIHTSDLFYYILTFPQTYLLQYHQ
jgi:hypothetical protein